jgi:aminoglycoside phosphotransferase (APT) family kinase protein
LRTLLGSAGPLTGPAEQDALLDRLPAAVTDLPPRLPPRDPLFRLEHFAGVLAATAVDAAGAGPLLASLAGRIASADPGEHPLVPVHGDFYAAQLLAADGAVTGLLDLDTAGAGHRIDEWATLLAHLSLLAAEGPGAAGAGRYGAVLLRHAEGRWPPGQLRPRIAAALVALATGPFRVQQPRWPDVTRARLTLAERWLAGAGCAARTA